MWAVCFDVDPSVCVRLVVPWQMWSLEWNWTMWLNVTRCSVIHIYTKYLSLPVLSVVDSSLSPRNWSVPNDNKVHFYFDQIYRYIITKSNTYRLTWSNDGHRGICNYATKTTSRTWTKQDCNKNDLEEYKLIKKGYIIYSNDPWVTCSRKELSMCIKHIKIELWNPYIPDTKLINGKPKTVLAR